MKKIDEIIFFFLALSVASYILAVAPLYAEPLTITETQLEKLTILCNGYKTERAEALKSLETAQAKLKTSESELKTAQASTENLRTLLAKSETERQELIKQTEKLKNKAQAWKTCALVSFGFIALIIIALIIAIKL